MVLYVCSLEKTGGGLPGPLAHPCGRAAKALDDAGHGYELKTVKGGSLKLWTLPSGPRTGPRSSSSADNAGCLSSCSTTAR